MRQLPPEPLRRMTTHRDRPLNERAAHHRDEPIVGKDKNAKTEKNADLHPMFRGIVNGAQAFNERQLAEQQERIDEAKAKER